jgi:competence protein ComEA
MKPLFLGLILSTVSILGLAGSGDLNTATAAEIAKYLHGIGWAKAQKIIEYRQRFGPIDTPEELLVIKGIGEKTLEKIVLE